ncbi:C2 domain containing protein [Trema orientale]|uniref:C2 domain containing protein n=1 Tax=Trema orientale TaxID=63057 RepID=A0A2P5ES55_TREOI|nr:C2 domain containing protein [Trema orientale]
MELRSLEINVISARDLKDVNLMTKMDVYAVVSISGESHNHQKTKTNVDRASGRNPTWNFPAKFTVDESAAKQNRLTLVFTLFCDRTLGDKEIGQVNVPVKELLDSSSSSSMQFVSYQVRKPSGKPKGELHFSYKFGEKLARKPDAGEPITAYPAVEVGPSAPPTYLHPPPPAHGGYVPVQPVVGYGGGYPVPPAAGYGAYPPPPPPPGYGYPPPPPPHGYGYPTGPGYGYPPPQQVGQKKNNKFGMGLGAGLLGGALGGLLIGDMVSDAASYDAGYDAGFGDGGGFDF